MKYETQDKAKEKDFFDRFSSSREYDVFTAYGYNSIIREYLKRIRIPAGPAVRAIDLGCGTGNFTRRFNKKYDARFYGIDISVKSVQLAVQLPSAPDSENIQYCAGDIEQCCFKDNTFDIVLFSGVLHHFEDYNRCVKEAFRILKKGGCMLSYDPSIRNPAMWLYRHPSSPLFSAKGKTDNERLLSAEELADIMTATGFANIDTRCIGGVTFKYLESAAGRLLLPIYNLFEFLLGISPFSSRYGSFLIGYGEKI